MKGNFSILSIDGTTGVGKSTQISLMNKLLKSKGFNTKIFKFSEVENTNSTHDILLQIISYLKQFPDGIALCDGSIATDIVDDIVNNMSSHKIYNKHSENIQIYQSMSNSYDIINVLITPANIDMCYERIKKRTDIYKEKEVLLDSKEHLLKTALSLKNFDNSDISTNMKFNNIDIYPEDSMLDMHHQIIDLIEKNT